MYRLYAENKKFETLNMIKPIKFSQRKVVNIEEKTKMDSEYLSRVKEYTKEMKEVKESNNQFIARNDEKYQKQV